MTQDNIETIRAKAIVFAPTSALRTALEAVASELETLRGSGGPTGGGPASAVPTDTEVLKALAVAEAPSREGVPIDLWGWVKARLRRTDLEVEISGDDWHRVPTDDEMLALIGWLHAPAGSEHPVDLAVEATFGTVADALKAWQGVRRSSGEPEPPILTDAEVLELLRTRSDPYGMPDDVVDWAKARAKRTDLEVTPSPGGAFRTPTDDEVLALVAWLSLSYGKEHPTDNAIRESFHSVGGAFLAWKKAGDPTRVPTDREARALVRRWLCSLDSGEDDAAVWRSFDTPAGALRRWALR